MPSHRFHPHHVEVSLLRTGCAVEVVTPAPRTLGEERFCVGLHAHTTSQTPAAFN